jgi:hypothetical protein
VLPGFLLPGFPLPGARLALDLASYRYSPVNIAVVRFVRRLLRWVVGGERAIVER